METLKDQLLELASRLKQLQTSIDIEGQRRRLRELEAKATHADFWQDGDAARSTMRTIDGIKNTVSLIDIAEQKIADAISVSDTPDLEEEVRATVREVGKSIRSLEIITFLSGPYDQDNAILSIHAGQGGTEAMDWAQMLLRMYMRFAQRQGWEVEVVDQTAGEEAGIKSATLIVSGRFAYGYLKGEAGTHRLVRLSPFNANNLRQTSFALVEAMPQIEDSGEIEMKEDDLEWQFFRASSQGGQNVQKVSTAVRVIHKPTGITVTAQTERFQEQNRKIALNLLRAKLWARKEAIEKEQIKEIKGEYRPASWGTQIRSYVLHPYQMVKDLRTEVETSDTEGILDGNISLFVEAELKL